MAQKTKIKKPATTKPPRVTQPPRETITGLKAISKTLIEAKPNKKKKV